MSRESRKNPPRYSDLVWHHQLDGRLKAWLMRGLTRGDEQPLGLGRVPDTNWKIGAIVDLDDDTHPDLV